ncbi:MAG TPA: signal recognition particle-docking protein FtsY [Candidatus Hydrogenedentes bacterium]|nr:signal recognition particle-docking protein FtsY [Candidatus Hydrogenedentota bacterium]
MSENGFFARLKKGLDKTRAGLVGGIKRVFAGADVNVEMFEALEESLISADVGVETSMRIVQDMRARAKVEGINEPGVLYTLLKEEMAAIMEAHEVSLDWRCADGPHVMLVAGVNGSGKTTTAGKIAYRLAREKRTVILGAADTFRAAAGEQLAIWAERAGAQLIRHQEGADPGAVAYDTVDAGIARHADNVIIDTAGRLHTKVNLMEELKKVQRVIAKRQPGAPHEVLLVLDATTGQNGLQQARQFTQSLTVTGIILTKLDGTAKGGMAIAIQEQLGIPIKLIGVGEGVEDLQPFDAKMFVAALFD